MLCTLLTAAICLLQAPLVEEIVTVQKKAEFTYKHSKAVAAQSTFVYSWLSSAWKPFCLFSGWDMITRLIVLLISGRRFKTSSFLGLPAQLAAFQAQMAGFPEQAEQLAALQLQVNAIQAAQQQQHRNSLLRLANSQARTGPVSLQVISKEHAVGRQPLGAQPAVQPRGPYPATKSDVDALTHGELDTLALFYHEDFGISPTAAQRGQATTPILQRRRMFALFIGAPQP